MMLTENEIKTLAQSLVANVIITMIHNHPRFDAARKKIGVAEWNETIDELIGQMANILINKFGVASDEPFQSLSEDDPDHPVHS